MSFEYPLIGKYVGFPIGIILSCPFGQCCDPIFLRVNVPLKNPDFCVKFLIMEKPGKLRHRMHHGFNNRNLPR